MRLFYFRCESYRTMSLATQKMPVVKVVDSRLSFPEWAVPVREGGNVVSYLSANATSKGAQVSFSLNPPNPGGSVLARDILIYNKLTFTVAGAEIAGVPLVNIGSTDAPRAYPWSSCIDNISLNLNNETISVGNWSDIGHVMRRFNPRASLYKKMNICPWFPDQSAVYQDLVGSNRNPLASGTVGDYDYLRGAYARCYTTGAVTTTAATIVLETVEPLTLAPFLPGSTAPGIPFVQTLNLDFTCSNYARALSRALGYPVGGADTPLANFTSISAVHNDSRIFYQSIALPLTEEAVPREVSLPHYRLATNTAAPISITSAVPTLNGTIPPGTNMQSPVIIYPSVPSRIYVFAQPTASSKNVGTPDYTAMYCGQLQVMWNSRTALMTSTTREELYQQAVDAGYAGPWESWQGFFRKSGTTAIGSSGSILCIRPGIDFDLEAGTVVGQAGSYQFQVSANFQDQSGLGAGGQAPFVLYVVAVLNGVLTINAGYEAHQVFGAVTQADVLAAKSRVSSEEVYDTFGSGFFDNLKGMITRAVPFLQKGARAAHAGLSAAKDAGLLGSAAFSGGDIPSMYGGSAMSGGARLSKRDLSARLR